MLILPQMIFKRILMLRCVCIFSKMLHRLKKLHSGLFFFVHPKNGAFVPVVVIIIFVKVVFAFYEITKCNFHAFSAFRKMPVSREVIYGWVIYLALILSTSYSSEISDIRCVRTFDVVCSNHRKFIFIGKNGRMSEFPRFSV